MLDFWHALCILNSKIGVMKKNEFHKDFLEIEELIELNENRISEQFDAIVTYLKQGDFEEAEKISEENERLLLVHQLYLKTKDNLRKFYKNVVKEIDYQLEDEDIKDELSREEWLIKTIEKEVLFDEYHPYFNDQSFLTELFENFVDKEEYEMCNYLSNYVKKC